jgi:membrane protein
MLISLAFRAYLSHFNNYSVTYGSLGAVIILMLWFYLTGAAILLGGALNAEIENAATEADPLELNKTSLVSSDPISAYPELPQHRAESAKEEEQSQGGEKDGERENEP